MHANEHYNCHSDLMIPSFSSGNEETYFPTYGTEALEPFTHNNGYVSEAFDPFLADWMSILPEYEVCFKPQPAANPIHTSKSSLDIFNLFITRKGNKIDASGIISRECYELWLSSRYPVPKFPEESFRKTITWLLVKESYDKTVFPDEVREAVIEVLSQPRIWPCFQNRKFANGKSIMIGIKGLRCLNKLKRTRSTDSPTQEKRRKQDLL